MKTASIISLIVLGLFFLLFLRGYDYISYTLFFIAFFIFAMSYFPKTLKMIVLIATIIGFIYFCIIEIPIIKNRKTDADGSEKYIIVLGAAVHGDVPSLTLEHRLMAAYDFLYRNKDAVAIVSGGQGYGENLTEAQCMKNYLIEAGIDESRIIEENFATSTMENLQFSKEIILSRGDSIENVGILSSPYHLYRAKFMARGLGYENPKGVACIYGLPIYTVCMFIREAFGVTHMWVFGD